MIVYRKAIKNSFKEQQMHIKEKALDKISRIAYKDLIFSVISDVKKGNFDRGIFDGDLYKVKLKQDSVLEYVYGKIEAVFKIDHENKTYDLVKIEPEDLILEVHKKILPTYKGIMYRNEKDKFKIEYALAIKHNDNKTC